MGGRYVIDTNWLGDMALADFLAKSPGNQAVIPEMTLVEVHKDAASYNARQLLRTLCAYPRQVIILRGTHDLYRDGGAGKGLINRLIDTVQTANFDAYCRTVIHVADDDLTDAHFTQMEGQSRDQIADLRANVSNILALFERCVSIFDERELQRLRKRIPYGGDLQRKLIYLSMDMHKMLLRSLSIEQHRYPRDTRRALNTFVFRYALCVVIFLTRWIRQGESKKIKTEHLVNHVMDLKTAAVATFFDGLKTHDEMPREVHLEVKHILGAVGAHVNCGKGPRR